MTDRFVWVGCRILMFIGIFFIFLSSSFYSVYSFLLTLFFFLSLPFFTSSLSLFLLPSFPFLSFSSLSIFFQAFSFPYSFSLLPSLSINIFPSFPLPQTIPKNNQHIVQTAKDALHNNTIPSTIRYALHHIGGGHVTLSVSLPPSLSSLGSHTAGQTTTMAPKHCFLPSLLVYMFPHQPDPLLWYDLLPPLSS